MDCYALLTEYSISLLDDMKKRVFIIHIFKLILFKILKLLN